VVEVLRIIRREDELMRNTKSYSWKERLMVVAILLIVTLVVMHSLLQSMKESERGKLDTAAVEYVAVKGMYADKPAPGTTITATAMNAETDRNRPTR
jgi:hypothetical protein